MKSRALTLIVPATLLAALAMPGSMAAQVAGTGTTNHIPVWTNSNTLGDSKLSQAGGNVGIRTTSPTATLDVIGPKGSSSFSSTAGQNALKVLRVTGGAGGLASKQGGSGGAIQLLSGGGGSICNNQPCCVGLPPCGIHFTGGGGAGIQIGGGLGANGGSGNGGSITLLPGTGGLSCGVLTCLTSGHPGNVILAPSGGNVGVGQTSPGHTLEIKVGGTTLADEWTTRSSRRFKTNIEPLQSALQKVGQLQGVSYQRKDDGKREIGVIAEDVARILPEVVSRDPETQEIQGVDYSRLAALLIEAVKSQQAEIQELRVRIERLSLNPDGQ